MRHDRLPARQGGGSKAERTSRFLTVFSFFQDAVKLGLTDFKAASTLLVRVSSMKGRAIYILSLRDGWWVVFDGVSVVVFTQNLACQSIEPTGQVTVSSEQGMDHVHATFSAGRVGGDSEGTFKLRLGYGLFHFEWLGGVEGKDNGGGYRFDVELCSIVAI